MLNCWRSPSGSLVYIMLFIILVAFIVFLFGASIGSFISASVYRMRKKETILGRSHCPKCGFGLEFFDLFPIFSYIFLRGKCRKCKKGIELSDFIVEIASGILFAFAFFYRWVWSADAEAFSLLIIRDWIFLGGLIFLFIYDFKYRILPDKITLPLIIILFVYNIFLGVSVYSLLLGVVIGGGFFFLQWLVSRGKWVGGGDIRMGALLGAGLGFPGVILALFLAYIFGGIVSGILLAIKKVTPKTEIAFGTFLAVGGGIALFWGDWIINFYLGLL